MYHVSIEEAWTPRRLLETAKTDAEGEYIRRTIPTSSDPVTIRERLKWVESGDRYELLITDSLPVGCGGPECTCNNCFVPALL